ncbi:MAG: shikimate kinase [Vampirovibrionales bacterium]
MSSSVNLSERWQTHPRIWLTGYMGAGKSTVGKHLARQLGWGFTDTDRELTSRYNKPMSQIFADHGEAAFRQAELELLKQLATSQRRVISTGGGTLVRQEAMAVALASGVVVYLKAPVELLFERVIYSPKDRPMIDVPDAEAMFVQRFREREPFYLQAHVSVPTGQGKPHAVVEAIAQALSISSLLKDTRA